MVPSPPRNILPSHNSETENSDASTSSLDATVAATSMDDSAPHFVSAAGTTDWNTTIIGSSTVSRMPHELWRNVFIEVHADTDPHESFLEAVHLSSVCRMWRHVAISTGKIWSTIYITLDRKPDVLLNILDIQLARAGHFKLDITATVVPLQPLLLLDEREYDLMHNEYKEDSTEICNWERVLGLLSRCKDQWRTISVSVRFQDTLVTFFEALSRGPEAINLERLACWAWIQTRTYKSWSIRDYRLPALRNLSLQRLACWTYYDFIKCAPSIEELIIDENFSDLNPTYHLDTDIYTFLAALQNLQELRSLFVGDLNIEELVHVPDPPAYYALRSLAFASFSGTESELVAAFFNLTEAPVLEHIELLGTFAHPHPCVDHVLTQIQTSGRFPSLRSITFEDILCPESTETDKDLIASLWLHNMQWCTSLQLRSKLKHDTMIWMLIDRLSYAWNSQSDDPDAIPRVLCPKLTTLKLLVSVSATPCATNEKVWMFLRKLVEMRKTNVACARIHTLHVDMCGRGMLITNSKRRWFEANVPDFSYRDLST